MWYWVPLAERETTTINRFHRWEQAFRVFTNIYVNAFPRKSVELVQYNQIIHTAAQTFTWENVYRYDREFSLHMSKHNLVRSSSVILQQAWATCLKDRVTNNSAHGGNYGGNGGNSRGNHSGVRRKLCFDFNVPLDTDANLTTGVRSAISSVTELLIAEKLIMEVQMRNNMGKIRILTTRMLVRINSKAKVAEPHVQSKL